MVFIVWIKETNRTHFRKQLHTTSSAQECGSCVGKAQLLKTAHTLVTGKITEMTLVLTSKLPPWCLAFTVPESAVQAAWGEETSVIFYAMTSLAR